MAEDSSASHSSPPVQSTLPQAHSSSVADDAKLSDKAVGGRHDAGDDNATIIGKKGETKGCSH
jgi:hypothetical protein